MQLFPHQSKALDETKDFKRVAYYLDMGLGKTFVGGEKAKQLDSSGRSRAVFQGLGKAGKMFALRGRLRYTRAAIEMFLN